GLVRGRPYILASLTAASALTGCAENAKVAAGARSVQLAAATTMETAAIVPARKPRLPHSGDTDKLDVIGLDQYEIVSRLGPSVQDEEHLPAVEAVFST